MNDKTKCLILLRSIQKGMNPRVVKELYSLLDKNQNQPPEGAADGSISEDEWRAISKCCVLVTNFVRALDFLEKLQGNPNA